MMAVTRADALGELVDGTLKDRINSPTESPNAPATRKREHGTSKTPLVATRRLRESIGIEVRLGRKMSRAPFSRHLIL